MTDAKKLAVKSEDKAAQSAGIWTPFEALRTEIDRLFDDFVPSSWRSSDRSPFARGFPSLNGWIIAPAVDVIEREDAFEVTAEVPGLDERNIEVKLSNGCLTIRGEKQEEKEDRRKEYHLSERRYGSFQRTFRVPDEVDADKVEAVFEKGVLRVKLPKRPEAKKNERKVEIKAA